MKAALAGVLGVAVLVAVAMVVSSGGRSVSLEERNFASSAHASGRQGKARQQQLSGVYGLDFGEESGVAEGIDESKDDIRAVKAMAGVQDDNSNPLQMKLQKLEKKTVAFEKEEAAFYKQIDAPAQTDIEVTQGPPGKPGKRGYR